MSDTPKRKQWFGQSWFCWLTAFGVAAAWQAEFWWFMTYFAALWIGHVVLDIIKYRKAM
jgi:hypothetical protein